MSHCVGAYTPFYRCLIFFGLLLFGRFFALSNDLLAELLGSDKSYLSGVILFLFLLTSLDAGRRARHLGSELCSASDIAARVQEGEQLFVTAVASGVRYAQENAPDSYAHHHLLLLANKTYFYRCYATNATETAWAGNTEIFGYAPGGTVPFLETFEPDTRFSQVFGGAPRLVQWQDLRGTPQERIEDVDPHLASDLRGPDAAVYQVTVTVTLR